MIREKFYSLKTSNTASVLGTEPFEVILENSLIKAIVPETVSYWFADG